MLHLKGAQTGKSTFAKTRLTDEQKLKIGRWVILGFSARKIQRLLVEEAPDGRGPSHVTVCRYAKKVSIDEVVVPWGSGWPEAPEEIAHLLRLLELEVRLGLSRPLDWRVAKWALRLRIALGPAEKDEDLERHIILAGAYARLEWVGKILGKPPDTADLDGIVMARPWESEDKQSQYNQAVKEGRIPAWSLVRELKAIEAIWPGTYKKLIGKLRRLRSKRLAGGSTPEEAEEELGVFGRLLLFQSAEKDPEYETWLKQQQEEERHERPSKEAVRK